MTTSEFDKVTRITVVGPDSGVVFERYGLYKHGVELHLQDDGRTLKIFPRSNVQWDEVRGLGTVQQVTDTPIYDTLKAGRQSELPA
jgi:hypothetical protein